MRDIGDGISWIDRGDDGTEGHTRSAVMTVDLADAAIGAHDEPVGIYISTVLKAVFFSAGINHDAKEED